MKNKVTAILISALFVMNSAYADSSFFDASDYTGDEFFTPPALQQKQERESVKNKKHSGTHTIPPVKKLRLTIKQKYSEYKQKQSEFAPVNPESDIYTKENTTSDFASQDLKEEFDENMMPDGFEADAQAVEENVKAKHFWKKSTPKENKNINQEDTENIVLDCDNMDYDTDKYCLYATGNVSVEFVKQKTTIKADIITYDRMNNTIKAEGNVRILKGGQTITGDYIFVDMNEENALIENPLTRTATIQMRANKGYVYGDKIVQEQGSIDVEESFPINFSSANRGPHLSNMIVPKNQTLTKDIEKGIIGFNAKEITITQKGDLETVAIRHANIKKGTKTVFKVPAIKIYTNKNHDYYETNFWELGSYRGLGAFIGPGFVFELPKGSVLKAIPMLNYKDKIGVGAIARFSSGTNQTQAAYATSKDKVLVHGKQELDDNLYLQYGVNDYMQEWFLGRRRPKYGVDLVYQKAYTSNDFLLKGHQSAYTHRFDAGYYHDIDEDKHYRAIKGSDIGTTRFKYMAEASQNLLNYQNIDKQTAFSFDAVAQLSAAVYGTGDTQVIGRLGPRMHTQWRRWMQDVGYYQSVYHDDSPVPVFDAYRYGKSNLYLRESLRLCRFLTLSWFSSINLSNDSFNNKHFQENAFYLSVGPDDMKFHMGYDFIRDTTFFTIEMMMDAKGSHINYDKLVIKQDKKAKKDKQFNESETEENNFQQDMYKAPVLQRAVVEDVKTVEDVL